MAGAKYLRNHPTLPGIPQEFAANDASAGAADAGKLVALNAAGVLDATIVNSTVASAGAAAAGKVPALDASGRLDNSVLPVGVGTDTATISASETIANGAYVNVWSSTGAFKVRNADASVAGKEAHGFCLVGGASGAALVVYFEGTNSAVTGQAPGVVYLSTTPGLGTAVAPTGSGNAQQRIGFATSATSVNFQSENPLIVA
jgi:hypothetical protein